MTERLGIVSVSESKNISVVRNEKCANQVNHSKPIPDVETLTVLYPECFSGIGHMPGKFHIELKDDAVPVVAAPRKYPIQLTAEIRQSWMRWKT
jgi:hypothetical protein